MSTSNHTVIADLAELCNGPLSQVLHPIDYIQGLIFAVSASPEIPMPETWLVWVFNQRGQLNSPEQADRLTDLLMATFQNQLRLMRDEQLTLPEEYIYPETYNVQPNVSQWLNGLLAGHSRLERVWQNAWQNVAERSADKLPRMQKDLKYCLGMFTTFADIPLAIEQAKKKGNLQLEENLPTVFLSLSDALNKYVGLSGTLVEFLPDQFETFVKQD